MGGHQNIVTNKTLRTCMVFSCKNKGPVFPGIRYFCLTKTRWPLWKRALRRTGDKMTTGNLVCSEHFAEEDKYIEDGKLRLVRGAIPKLKLGYNAADSVIWTKNGCRDKNVTTNKTINSYSPLFYESIQQTISNNIETPKRDDRLQCVNNSSNTDEYAKKLHHSVDMACRKVTQLRCGLNNFKSVIFRLERGNFINGAIARTLIKPVFKVSRKNNFSRVGNKKTNIIDTLKCTSRKAYRHVNENFCLATPF